MLSKSMLRHCISRHPLKPTAACNLDTKTLRSWKQRQSRFLASAAADAAPLDPRLAKAKRIVVFSGIQPTGSMHLGNYFGAVQSWIKLHRDPSRHLYACIVDLHSMSMPWNVNNLRTNIETMQIELLACGLDPEHCTLFRQSDVPEHCELAWLLTCISTMARLDNMPQYKEKSQTVREVPGGLFIYPVLQAADILVYKANEVPVGDDNLQNLQLVQHLAQTFNRLFGRLFPRPKQVVSTAPRVLSLRDPAKKMSKSDVDIRSRIDMNDTPDAIREKIKKAVTDFDPVLTYDEQTRPGISNMLKLYGLCTNTTDMDGIVQQLHGVNKVIFKERLAEALIEHLRPIQTKFYEISKDKQYVNQIYTEGARKAKTVAAETMREVRQLVGLKPP